MKRCIMLLLTVLVLLFSACGNGNQAPPGETETVPGDNPSPTATPTPDFAGTDFSGRWHVSEIIDSNGLPVSDAEKQNMGAGFILELIANGSYFVYGADGKLMGQGTFSIALNQLTLAAQGSQTVYEIIDADTLRITQPDTSITTMKREPKEPAEEGDVVEGDTPEGSETIEEESDFQDEPVPPDTTPSGEASPPAAQ